jgi:tetratricopeptide (TPR) repeat protein
VHYALLGTGILASVLSLGQDAAPSASLQGTILDANGKPIAQAAVVLEKRGSAESFAAQSDADGKFSFNGLKDGLYNLRASKAGFADAKLDSLFLGLQQTKTVDLTLGVLQAGKASQSSTPQFFDQPQFTVAGVKDTTTLGGHGSDTVVRIRDSLAKETVSLGGAKAKESSNEADRADTQRLLATHESADLHHRLADLDEKLGDSLEAVHHYQRAAEMDPSEPHLFDWGAELLLHHAPQPAEGVFSKGAQRYPNSARMLLGLGAASFARGNSDDATRKICQASDLNPRDPSPYVFLGKIEQSEIFPSNDVIEKLRRFVALQPQRADAYYYYAVGLWKRRNHSHQPDADAEVETLLKQALRINPKYAAAELQFGIVAAGKQDYTGAISHYQKALEADSQLLEAHYRLAQAYRATGASDKAKEEVRIYGLLAKESAQRQDQERSAIKQFVYTLRDQSAPQPH